jgi:hypothetical protein
MEAQVLEEPDGRPLGPAARVGLGLLGLVLVGAGLVAGFFAVSVVAAELGARRSAASAAAELRARSRDPGLSLAADRDGLVSLACRYPRGLRPVALLAAALVADVLLAVWLVRLPTGSCVANPPRPSGGAIEATGCLDRSWSPP